jgi:HD-like signal output (HDOD) protein
MITLAQVCEKAVRLPCSPALLPRIIELIAKEDVSVDQLEKVIRLDTVLASSTLRLANSAYFAGSDNQVDSLEQAIQRLGLKEIYRLAALSLTGRWMNFAVEGYRWEPGDFCRLALVTAVAAEFLAERTNRVDPRIAYTAGLVHEVGKLAVAYCCSEHFGAIRERQRAAGCTWLAAEKQVLGFNHAEAGTALLRQWKFPATLVAAAECNPPTASAPAEALPLLVTLHAAKYLAITMGPGVAEDGFLFELNAPMLMEWGFTTEVLEGALPEVLARSSRLLQEQLTHGSLKF